MYEISIEKYDLQEQNYVQMRALLNILFYLWFWYYIFLNSWNFKISLKNINFISLPR